MSKIAKDYLPIYQCAVQSDWAFSSNGITPTAYHNPLLPETFGAPQMLNSAYHQGHISTVTAAELAAVDKIKVYDRDFLVSTQNIYVSK